METPPKNPENFALNSQISYTLVGWDRVRKTLSSLAEADETRQYCLTLKPTTNFETAQLWLKETKEMVHLNQSTEKFPIKKFSPLAPILQAAKEHIFIEVDNGLSILKFLKIVSEAYRYLKKNPEVFLLKHYGEKLDPLNFLKKELERCIDPEGEIKEDASPELKEAIREFFKTKQGLENAVKKILSKYSSDVLQDMYYTEREGRVVFPVRAEARSRFEGIVHDSSGSGQTLFMEPTTLLSLNNQLKISRLKVDQEKNRILSHLAKEILTNESTLKQNEEQLILLDLLNAKSRLAELMAGRNVILHESGAMNLIQARNPELILEGQPVVPNNIHWNESTKVIIISGPNTGGKTVTLKTVGLMSIMVRAGLFLPVGENSEMRFFPEVFADIGDNQSVQLQLSTFSAHLNKINYFLNNAPDGALILLDEIGVATNPQEGAALAEAILMEMKQRGLVTLVSTHYLTLKTLAQTQPGFMNACTEFDAITHKPTYRLIFGVPGQSAAIETAERLGLDPKIISIAQSIYNKTDHRAEELLNKLNLQMLALNEKENSLQAKVTETQKLYEEQKTLTDSLREKENDLAKTKSKKVQTFVREAKREIRNLLQTLKENPSSQKLKKAEKQIHQLGIQSAQALSDLPSDWNIPVEQLKKGDEVLVKTYDAIGKLLENPNGKTKVRILLGKLPTLIDANQLFGNSQKSLEKKNKTSLSEINIRTETQSLPNQSCDLRGMRVDEAQGILEAFLSQAVVNKLNKITIIHGHGMGKIKSMVRDYLGSTGIGKSFRPGERHEGGDGVTIVEF